MKIDAHTMMQALPMERAVRELRELADSMKAEGAQVVTIFELDRRVREIEDAYDRALNASPVCCSRQAADILGVSERQARNIAKDDRFVVKFCQPGGDGCKITYDVRSLYAHLAGERRAA